MKAILLLFDIIYLKNPFQPLVDLLLQRKAFDHNFIAEKDKIYVINIKE